MNEVSVIFQSPSGPSRVRVGYWDGSSVSSIAKSAEAALNITQGLLVLAHAESGLPLVSSDAFPRLTTVRATFRGAANNDDRSPLISLQDTITQDLPDDQAFQNQYVKFERVLSHLANERTWLAWIRVSLTLLSTAFIIWQLYSHIPEKHPRIKAALHWLGIGYALVVPLTTICGWIRYERTKTILGLSDGALNGLFGSIGVAVQAALLGAIFVLTVGCYASLGEYYIFDH